MRSRSIVLAATLLAAIAGRAQAQYLNPYTGNWLMNAPATVGGLVGGQAKPEPPQQCITILSGRQGPRAVCSPMPEATPPAHR